MMTLLRLICYSTLIAFICGESVLAQTVAPSAQAPVAEKNTQDKVQSLNFEDELVEGTAQKPEFFYLFQKKNFNYKRLIRLRENFIPEMRRSSEDIQRLRGGR